MGKQKNGKTEETQEYVIAPRVHVSVRGLEYRDGDLVSLTPSEARALAENVIPEEDYPAHMARYAADLADKEKKAQEAAPEDAAPSATPQPETELKEEDDHV